MLRQYEKTGYLLALLAVCGFLFSWKFFFAPDRAIDVDQYQNRLKITRDSTNASSAEDPDESLRIYAVTVVGLPAFKSPSIAVGIYLGRGLILTPASVVGHYPFAASPHVLIAGEDLLAKIVKIDSSEQTNLALLSVDQQQLPIPIRLRQTPLCPEPITVWTQCCGETRRSAARQHLLVRRGRRRGARTWTPGFASG